MSNNYIDELFDNLRRDPFNNNPTNETSYELQKDFLDDPQGPEGWIADGVITDVELVDGSTLVGKVDALPTLPADGYPEGKVVYLTTNGKLYRNDSDVWTSAVPTVDLTGQITETQITDSAITTNKVAANAIVADKIASNAITTDKLNANAVTAAKIAAGTITATEIAASTITAANIATGTITAAQMATGTITAASAIIADGAITNAKIADATIQSAKISNLVVSKVTSGTKGMLLQGAASGVDAAFGGIDDALLFSGIFIQDVGITSIADGALAAPNKVYLSPDAVVLPDTTTGSGVSIVGEEGVSITSPQALIGTADTPLTGDTAYFGPSYFGGMPDGVIIYSELNDVTLEAAGVVNLNAPTTEVSGDLNVQGAITIQGAGIIPPGVVEAYLGAYNNIPNGWLLCDNSYVSRTTYAELFAVIGTSYGTTTASNFRLPNLFGHMLVGGTSTTVPASGQQTGTGDSYLNATWDHNHIHSHVTDPAATTSGTPSTVQINIPTTGGATAGSGTHTHSTNIAATTSDSDSTAMSTSPTQKRTRVNYIIKY